MSTITMEKTVGELVSERPARSRVFEKYGIDFCCGGKKPLAEACAKKGVTPEVILAALADTDAEVQEDAVDYSAMALDALVDHIVATHHAYLAEELPRLKMMAQKVSRVHGDKDSRLMELAHEVDALSEELQSHMMKEEQILFPIIRELAHATSLPQMHCGNLANPIRIMEAEHDSAGNVLKNTRRLTDGYTPPEWACNTYRALLDGLHELEVDLHLHIHKENNILFPRALELEASLA